MFQPDESGIAVSGIKVRPVARENVSVQVDPHIAGAVTAVEASRQAGSPSPETLHSDWRRRDKIGVCRSIFNPVKSVEPGRLALMERSPPSHGRRPSTLERLYRLQFFDSGAAFFAGATGIVVPKIEHGLAEMLHDIFAIEMDVFHERAAVFAVENDVFLFAGWSPAFHHDANRVRGALG
jgi:hypothetical protein